MKKALLYSVLSYILLWLLSLIFFNISALDPLEKAFQDFSYLDFYDSQRINDNGLVNNDIYVVNIERKNRSEIAYLINAIALQKPKVIALDAMFTVDKNSQEDSLLQDAIFKNQKYLVGSLKFQNGVKMRNLPKFQCNDEGFVNLNIKGQKDRVIRTFIGEYDGVKSFPLAIYKKMKPEQEVPFNLEAPQNIKYLGNSDKFIVLDFKDIFLNELVSLKDKVVIIGYLGTPTGNKFDIEDRHFTPLNEEFTGKSIPDMYGVLIHANILNMFLMNSYFKVIPDYMVFLIGFTLVFVTLIIFLPLMKKDYPWVEILIKIYQLFLTFIVLWIAFFLYKNNMKISVISLILAPVLCLELVPFFEFLRNKIIKVKNGKI